MHHPPAERTGGQWRGWGMARATPWIAPQCNNINKSLHCKVKYKPLKNGRFWGLCLIFRMGQIPRCDARSGGRAVRLWGDLDRHRRRRLCRPCSFAKHRRILRPKVGPLMGPQKSSMVNSLNYRGLLKMVGGRSEIRTHGGLAPTAVFKTAALNHSAILPQANAKRSAVLASSLRGAKRGSDPAVTACTEAGLLPPGLDPGGRSQ